MDSDSDYEEEREEIIGIMFDSSSEDSSQYSDPDNESWFYRRNYWASLLGQPFTDELEARLMDDAERIMDMEYDFLEEDKESGKYYIGSAFLIQKRYYIMNAAVSIPTFYRFPFHSVVFYLHELEGLVSYSIVPFEIMKLRIHPVTSEYIVVLKTFWLRIIQRRWRRILRERAEVLRKRCSIQNLIYRMTYGRHLAGLNILPGLHGMMTRTFR